MPETKAYAFVLDAEGRQLSPMLEQKAWYQIRKKKADLVSKYPLVVKLHKTVSEEEICKNEIRLGIDDGGKHVGIAIVQNCQTKNKVVFKGTIEQRNDVKHLMQVRKGYRHYRRYWKRYREKRFLNRASSKRKGRIAPSIMQKRQATLRVICQLNKWVNTTSYWLEDVAIDIRAFTDGYKPYKWQYQISNRKRLDENIRKAVIIRDGCMCRECGKTNTKLEVHHIKPRRLNGSNTLSNLITLCASCHDKTESREELFMSHYYAMIESTGDNKHLNYAQHVMQGKNYLREQLSSVGSLNLTTGGDTANKRIDWNIQKSHCNDAICITDSKPDTIEIKEYIIKPMRKQSKAKTDNVLGMMHRDIVKYSPRRKKPSVGYITALYPSTNQINLFCKEREFKKIAANSCKLLWRFSKIYWLDNSVWAI